MAIKVETKIDGPREAVWKVITDIENSERTITGIEKIEILDRPVSGLRGLKWRETRTLFGRTATEVMWITDVEENRSYKTRAENHGMVYTTDLVLSSEGDGTLLTMEFDAEAQTLGSRVMSATMGKLFEGATRDALKQDLDDIKKAVERTAT